MATAKDESETPIWTAALAGKTLVFTSTATDEDIKFAVGAAKPECDVK